MEKIFPVETSKLSATKNSKFVFALQYCIDAYFVNCSEIWRFARQSDVTVKVFEAVE